MADFSTNVEGCKRVYTLGSEDKYIIKFSSASCESYSIGTEFNGYYLAGNYTPSLNANTGGFDYELEFVAKWCMMKNIILKYDNNGVYETSFSVTLKLEDHIALINDAGMINVEGVNIPSGVNDRKCISYSSTSILDAVVAIAEAYKLDWWGEGDNLYIGIYKNSSGSSTLDPSKIESISGDTNSDFATGIYVFGGTKNLPSNYRNSSSEGSNIVNTEVVERHLHMPSGDSIGSVGTLGCVEKVVVFDDIYPKTQQTAEGVDSYTALYDNTAFSSGSYSFSPTKFEFDYETSSEIELESGDGILDDAVLSDDGSEFVVEGKTFTNANVKGGTPVKIGDNYYTYEASAGLLRLYCYIDAACTGNLNYEGELSISRIKYNDMVYTAVNSSGSEEGKVTEQFYVLYYPSTFSINNSYRLNGKAFEVTFGSGSLSGMTFEANWHSKGEILGDQSDYIVLERPCFEIIANTNYGIKLPNETLKPKTGDSFYIDNWDATKLDGGDALISAAEAELAAAGQAYFDSITKDGYSCQVTLISGETLSLGASVTINGISGYVIGYELDLATNGIKSPVYHIGKTSKYTRFGKLSNDVTNVQIESGNIDSDIKAQLQALGNSVNYSIQNQGQYARLKWVKDLINFVVGEDVYVNGKLVKTESGLALTKNTTRLYSLTTNGSIVNEAYVQTKVKNGRTELNMRADQVTINTASYTNKTLDEVIETLNGDVQKGDSEFVIWKANYKAPVDANGDVLESFGSNSFSPSKEWSSTEIVDHEGDFLVTTDGYVYNLKLVDTLYKWTIITDVYLNQAIKEAADAKEIAQNSKDKLDSMADDEVITYIEYAQANGLAYIWQSTQQEYADICSKIDSTMTGYSDYLTAYATVKTYMDEIVSHFEGTHDDYSLGGTDFMGMWDTYYAKRTVIQNSIQEAIDAGIKSAQDTADEATKIFSQDTLPTPPYKLGDHWICGSYTASDGTPYTNEEFYCKNARTSGAGVFSDWAILVNGARLNMTEDAIKAAVEKDLTSTGILVMDKNVKIYINEDDEPVSLFNVTDTSITLNSQIVAIDGTNISFNGKTLEMSASNNFVIKSPNFYLDKDKFTVSTSNFGLDASGNITANGGTIAGWSLYKNGDTSYMYGSTRTENVKNTIVLNPGSALYMRKETMSGSTVTDSTFLWTINQNGYAGFGGYKDSGTQKYANEFKNDGSGSLAKGNISWDGDGDLTVLGDVKANGLYLKDEDGDYHDVLDSNSLGVDTDGNLTVQGDVKANAFYVRDEDDTYHNILNDDSLGVDTDGNLVIRGNVYASGGKFTGDVEVTSLKHTIHKITNNEASQVVNDFATSDFYIGDGNGHSLTLDHASEYTGMELTFIDNKGLYTDPAYLYKGLYVKVESGDHIYCTNKDKTTGEVTNYAATEILVYNNVVKLMSDGSNWIMIYCQDNTEVVVTAS